MDSAFFSDAIVGVLDAEGVGFTISVPFERFADLKRMIEGRRRWRQFNDRCGFFESRWKSKSWGAKQRFVFIRTRNRKQYKEPVQLDLFIPYEYGYDFKAIITNKSINARKLLAYHNGRDAQEGVFSELKSQTQMDYIPTRRQTWQPGICTLCHVGTQPQSRNADDGRYPATSYDRKTGSAVAF